MNLLKSDHVEILNRPGQQVKIQLTVKGHPKPDMVAYSFCTGKRYSP